MKRAGVQVYSPGGDCKVVLSTERTGLSWNHPQGLGASAQLRAGCRPPWCRRPLRGRAAQAPSLSFYSDALTPGASLTLDGWPSLPRAASP